MVAYEEMLKKVAAQTKTDADTLSAKADACLLYTSDAADE